MKLPGGSGPSIAGHKIPWTMIGALAAVVGAFLVWRFNQGGGVSAGASSPIDTSGPSVYGQDYSATLANLSQQISNLTQDKTVGAAVTGTAASTSPAPPLTYGAWLAQAGRPDIAKAIRERRIGDLQGEYLKEVAASVTKTA